ncbi:stress response protein NST1-like isoform X1 [Quercus robur]|uniref:stress response protein NST1-like isoform X1 n=2 Tax=Quercus robur TaxID=38942 RepID=UPI002161CBC3|nr:stress response protein NST1-like isoform X1 [Quercus robur]XP_050260477.1 stress response protein NST1-like isoform X1 [Quercus robur]XP_050260478.1 stress response protein NST1-like isoform X1 [Quercus robur]XP_050260479.1 stress response protein NST1-like isoform X1 [Quercus robur]XP_050260480.1 stress response protein NST1-like isoform X1 [Quercus robur]XP_050260481.1 stress response protein NST1-like isoform X1 [Quercus robur]
MKRKKWSELEEQTLLTKYSELRNSGALAKLKTREKKFKPVADHVNAIHHLQDPATYPFKWSWRDVSIKVQNMRHQYLGVKQKIRLSNDEFNWKDGENHWVNFFKYKEVFGDVELDVKSKRLCENNDNDIHVFGDCGDLGFGIDCEDDEDGEEEDEDEEDEDEDEDVDDDDDEEEDEEENEENLRSEGEFEGERQNGEVGFVGVKKLKMGLGGNERLRLMGSKVLDLRDVMVKKEERKREREFQGEKEEAVREEKRREAHWRAVKRRYDREEGLENRELELEERELMWAKREVERRLRLEREFDEERRERMRMEEEREEKEMEWKERMLGLQIEHEKQMMQMQAEACQNQMQVLGVMARLVCQFFGSASDGLGGALGVLPPQVLHNLQHPGGLGDNGKPDANSPSEFMKHGYGHGYGYGTVTQAIFEN